MDNQMVFDLLKNTIDAAEILGKDADFAADLKKLKDQLPPMHVGKYGQLQEWLEDWDRETSGHRHVSHLWGMFPGNQISPYTNPQLFQAAKKIFRRKRRCKQRMVYGLESMSMGETP